MAMRSQPPSPSHLDFNQGLFPVVQVTRLSNGAFFSLPIFKLIAANDYRHRMVAFGDRPAVDLGSRVYDLSDPSSLYDLVKKVYKGENTYGEIFRRDFKNPVFLILPSAAQPSTNGVEYRTCVARGKKEDRSFIPVVKNEIWSAKNKDPQTGTIVMVSSLEIRPHDLDGVYQINMSPSIGDMQRFERAAIPVSQPPRGLRPDEFTH